MAMRPPCFPSSPFPDSGHLGSPQPEAETVVSVHSWAPLLTSVSSGHCSGVLSPVPVPFLTTHPIYVPWLLSHVPWPLPLPWTLTHPHVPWPLSPGIFHVPGPCPLAYSMSLAPVPWPIPCLWPLTPGPYFPICTNPQRGSETTAPPHLYKPTDTCPVWARLYEALLYTPGRATHPITLVAFPQTQCQVTSSRKPASSMPSPLAPPALGLGDSDGLPLLLPQWTGPGGWVGCPLDTGALESPGLQDPSPNSALSPGPSWGVADSCPRLGLGTPSWPLHPAP